MSDCMKKFLAALVSILIFNSCASFIDRPKELKEWKYEKKGSCPRVFKVYSERHFEYYLGDNNIYTCEMMIDGKGRSKCEKKNSFKEEKFVTDKDINSHHEKILKNLSKNYKCLQPSSKGEAEYEVLIKSKSYEPDRFNWAIITGVTLAIIPLRTTQNIKYEIQVKNLKNNQIRSIKYESHEIFWMHLFLLPLMPFIGEYAVDRKLSHHQLALIYSEIMKMSSIN